MSAALATLPLPAQVAVCALGWLLLLVVNALVLERRWPKLFGGAQARATKWDNASRGMGTAHGALCFVLSLRGMATEYARLGEWRYDDANSEALAPAMLCSVSFFAADLLFLFFDFSITGTPQTMFFVHHFVCIGYIVTCYLSGIGAQTVCAALVMAETTSPCQNTWYFSKVIGSMRVHSIMSYVYTMSYLLVRAVAGPLWSAHIIYFFLFKPNKFGSAVLPLTACIVLVNAGGIMWCRKLWAGFTKFLAKEAEAGGGLKQS